MCDKEEGEKAPVKNLESGKLIFCFQFNAQVMQNLIQTLKKWEKNA